jgi:ketosteroid isomerase-like protein
MWKPIIKRQLRRIYAAFNAGDAEPAIARFAPNAHFRIAGSGPLEADLHGSHEIARWLRALMERGLRWEIEDILINGSPRQTRLITRYTIHATSTNDPTWNYRGIQYAQLRWGKITLDDILAAPQVLS